MWRSYGERSGLYGDGPTPDSIWTAVCPVQCGLGTVVHNISQKQAWTLSLDGGTKVSEGFAIPLSMVIQYQGA